MQTKPETTNQDQAILEFKQLTKKFNELAGNTKNVNKEKLKQQLNLITEELLETVEALKQNDLVEVLDGYTDLMVTVVGLGDMLEGLGIKATEALVATAKNNDTKFISPYSLTLPLKTVDYYRQQGIDVQPEFSLKYNMYVMKDKQGKVRKPLGFISNDLTEFVPNELLANPGQIDVN
jgi:NTP pyrophosphatase (non-canonical NTP hydrolase)